MERITLDKKKIFWNYEIKKNIEELYRKIDQEDIQEVVNKSDFINKIEKIISNYPFLIIDEFIEKFIDGEDAQKLFEIYGLSDMWNRYEIVEKILGFSGRHFKKISFKNARELNLTNHKWKNNYENFLKNYDYFRESIEFNLVKNILRTLIIYQISVNSQPIEIKIFKENLKKQDKKLDYFDFINENNREKFNKKLEENFEKLCDDILNELLDNGILDLNKFHQREIFGRIKVDSIKNKIISILSFQNQQLTVSQINQELAEIFPSLKLIPNQKMLLINEHLVYTNVILFTALNELGFSNDSEPIIKINSKRHRINSSKIFLVENYQRIIQKIKIISMNNRKNIEKFYGREISPQKFIDELKQLTKGNLDDIDDQVTRIAGLVLAESVELIPPIENNNEFDFKVDISKYHFRQEQKEAMMELNFNLNSEIFHCKVALNDVIDEKYIKNLIQYLPNNENGILITFEKIDSDLKKFLENNKRIQIIDEEGLKIWVGITKIIPSRKFSICRIYSDPLTMIKNKIARIDSIDFEMNEANITILSDLKSHRVMLSSLEEIEIESNSISDFHEDNEKYWKFLEILSKITHKASFEKAFFSDKIIDHNYKNDRISIDFEFCHVLINLSGSSKNRIIGCNCLSFVENPVQLCSHCVMALDLLYRRFLQISNYSNKENKFSEMIDIILVDQIKIILDRLGVNDFLTSSEESMMKKLMEF